MREINRTWGGGSATIDFVAVLPVLLLLLYATYGIGSLYFVNLALGNAVRAGAQWALIAQATDLTEIKNKVVADAQNVLQNFSINNDNVSASVSASFKCSNGNTCTSPCDCSTQDNIAYDATPWIYVEIIATYKYKSAIDIPAFVGIPNTITNTKKAVFRLQ